MPKQQYYVGDSRSSLYPDAITELHGRLLHTVNMANWEGKKVLVVGDSYGWFAEYVLRHGAIKVVSFDIATPSAHIAKLEKEFPHFTHEICSVFDLSYRDMFDYVGYFEVIEHLPPHTELESLKAIHKSLVPGGYLLLSTPHKSLFSYLADPACFFGHRHYSINEMQLLLNTSRFRVDSIYRGGYFYAIVDILLLYFTKWILRKKYTSRLLYKSDKEYPNSTGITLFAIARK